MSTSHCSVFTAYLVTFVDVRRKDMAQMRTRVDKGEGVDFLL